ESPSRKRVFLSGGGHGWMDTFSLQRIYPISNASHGLDDFRIQFAPKMMHMHVDRVAFHVALPPVDVLLELAPAERLTGVFNELLEQHELPSLQIYRHSCVLDRHGAQIERESPMLQEIGRPATAPALQSMHS